MAKSNYRQLAITLLPALTLFSGASVVVASNGADPEDRKVLQRTSEAFNEVAQKATPAVVSINAIKMTSPEEGPQGLFPFGLPAPGMPGQEEEQGPGLGVGSGVIISPEGLIVTNHHVVENASSVTVSMDEKTKIKATVLGADPQTDIAILKLEEKGRPKTLPIINLGNSDDVRVGDWAVAIGSPFGLNQSVTTGIISAKGRGHLGVFDVEDFIQTDAAINPGNSGGPLLNLKGEMIGLNAAIFSQSGGNIGIGFSIPANIVKKISDQIVANGRVIRGWIGVSAQDIDEDLAKHFKVPQNQGALISNVTQGGPASKGSIQNGDVIVQFNKQPINGSSDLRKRVTETKSGSKVPVEVFRSGKRKELVLTIREQPQARPLPATQQAGRVAGEEEEKRKDFGIALQDIPPEFAQVLGLKNKEGALVVGVEPGSPAFESGISPGDVILQANQKNIGDAKSFQKLAKKSGDLMVLYVQRGPEQKIYVPVRKNVG